MVITNYTKGADRFDLVIPGFSVLLQGIVGKWICELTSIVEIQKK